MENRYIGFELRSSGFSVKISGFGVKYLDHTMESNINTFNSYFLSNFHSKNVLNFHCSLEYKNCFISQIFLFRFTVMFSLINSYLMFRYIVSILWQLWNNSVLYLIYEWSLKITEYTCNSFHFISSHFFGLQKNALDIRVF